MKILVVISLIILSSFFLSGCRNKERDEYYQACLDIADSMYVKNQFPTKEDYEKFKVQCKIGTDNVYGEK